MRLCHIDIPRVTVNVSNDWSLHVYEVIQILLCCEGDQDAGSIFIYYTAAI